MTDFGRVFDPSAIIAGTHRHPDLKSNVGATPTRQGFMARTVNEETKK